VPLLTYPVLVAIADWIKPTKGLGTLGILIFMGKQLYRRCAAIALFPHKDKEYRDELRKYNYYLGCIGIPQCQNGKPYCSSDKKSLEALHLKPRNFT
jgi:hypothetical protein